MMGAYDVLVAATAHRFQIKPVPFWELEPNRTYYKIFIYAWGRGDVRRAVAAKVWKAAKLEHDTFLHPIETYFYFHPPDARKIARYLNNNNALLQA